MAGGGREGVDTKRMKKGSKLNWTVPTRSPKAAGGPVDRLPARCLRSCGTGGGSLVFEIRLFRHSSAMLPDSMSFVWFFLCMNAVNSQ